VLHPTTKEDLIVENAAAKVVLVTGTGQGCGRVIAEDFAARGAAVVVNDIVDSAVKETVERITRMGGTAIYVHADVSVEQGVAALVDAASSVGSMLRSTTRGPRLLSPSQTVNRLSSPRLSQPTSRAFERA
jgi:NAD(P)-dependent dehydrogenase (short-subunit alcohol dehydrogenase family)